MTMRPRRDAALAVCLLAAVGCKAAIGELTARASDEWTRTYPLAANGELQITNANGDIDVAGVDGSTVDVRAERIARAATDEIARDLLPRIAISEEATPALIKIETRRVDGVLIGASFDVKYHVRVPRATLVRARTVNGTMTFDGLDGRLVANTVNGAITGRNLSGGIEARAVNGKVEIDVRSVGEDPVDLRATNGSLRLALPEKARVNVSAGTVNGLIDTSGLTLDLMGEQSRRRVRGRMNGGGTPIELNTVNGAIVVATH